LVEDVLLKAGVVVVFEAILGTGILEEEYTSSC